MMINKTEEFRMYKNAFEALAIFAEIRGFQKMKHALFLAEEAHRGQYRMAVGDEQPLPYITHVLQVCATLIAATPKMPDADLDTLYAAALLHDTMEDCPDLYPCTEALAESAGTDVAKVVQLLTKQHGATASELEVYFDRIGTNRMSTLIKLSDRSHNVSTMTAMRPEKKQEYIAETKRYVYPLSKRGKTAYPELAHSIQVIDRKIRYYTESA